MGVSEHRGPALESWYEGSYIRGPYQAPLTFGNSQLPSRADTDLDPQVGISDARPVPAPKDLWVQLWSLSRPIASGPMFGSACISPLGMTVRMDAQDCTDPHQAAIANLALHLSASKLETPGIKSPSRSMACSTARLFEECRRPAKFAQVAVLLLPFATLNGSSEPQIAYPHSRHPDVFCVSRQTCGFV